MREGGRDNGYNDSDMRRKLFSIFAAVSLILCVTTAVLWARSRLYFGRCAINLSWSTDNVRSIRRDVSIDSTGGTLTAEWTREIQVPAVPKPLRVVLGEMYEPDLGFDTQRSFRMTRHVGTRPVLTRSDPMITDDNSGVTFPHWLPMLVLAVAPLWWLGSLLSGHRRRIVGRACSAKGRCPACNYDLRATPDRCPECGRAVTTKGTMRAT
jgi:hypothetical protein